MFTSNITITIICRIGVNFSVICQYSQIVKFLYLIDSYISNSRLTSLATSFTDNYIFGVLSFSISFLRSIFQDSAINKPLSVYLTLLRLQPPIISSNRSSSSLRFVLLYSLKYTVQNVSLPHSSFYFVYLHNWIPILMQIVCSQQNLRTILSSFPYNQSLPSSSNKVFVFHFINSFCVFYEICTVFVYSFFQFLFLCLISFLSERQHFLFQ